jgi:hypothetical protein
MPDFEFSFIDSMRGVLEDRLTSLAILAHCMFVHDFPQNKSPQPCAKIGELSIVIG